MHGLGIQMPKLYRRSLEEVGSCKDHSKLQIIPIMYLGLGFLGIKRAYGAC